MIHTTLGSVRVYITIRYGYARNMRPYSFIQEVWAPPYVCVFDY